MGFLSNYHCVSILPAPLGAVLVLFFRRAKLAVAAALSAVACTTLGAHGPPLGEQDFVYVELDLSLLPSFSKDSSSSIKSALRVVEFASFRDDEDEEEVMECAVCLGEMEARDEVRELGNCRHAFHRGCIDKWVDMGQDTCPLCRARLLPYERDRESVLTCYNK